MSSARARIEPNLGRALRGIAWTALFIVLAAGVAGLIAEASHTPGSPARADLTYTGDASLKARLDAATAALEGISEDVDTLAEEAKTALAELTGGDPTKLEESLGRGSATASAIAATTRVLQDSLANLPGAEPDAVTRYSNDTLVRRAAVLAALDAAGGLDTHWEQVSARAVEVSELMTLLAQHDQIVLDAAGQGRSKQYARASQTLDQAILVVADVSDRRERLVADPGPTVLDEWIERNRDYDLALQSLYDALVESKGVVTPKVVVANREQKEALARLPSDRRAIIVIVSEAARSGLTQAVLAIEEAGGRLDAALDEAGDAAAPEATESSAPEGSLAPGETGAPLP